MKSSTAFLCTLFLLTNFASARTSVRAVEEQNSSNISGAQEFSLKTSGGMPTEKEVAEAVGVRIRHKYYKSGESIDGFEMAKVSLSKATKSLSKADGKFQGITDRERETLDSWIEDKRVREVVYKMTVNSNWYGADRVSVHYILLPTEFSDPILTIGYDQLSED